MLSLFAYLLILFLGRTQRWRVSDPAGVLRAPLSRRLIFAFWHNRLALMPYVYKRMLGRRPIAVMVSASRDGSKLVRVLQRFHLVTVRGSTSRFGPQALRELAEKIGEGMDAAITPDGPRGPRYEAQPGVVSLAQLSGAEIVPMSYRLSRKILLRSWDGFMVPIPFGRCELAIGAPISVPRDADDEVRAQKLKELQSALLALGQDKAS